MARIETIKTFTVIKSGKKYSLEDAPRDAKEAEVVIEVSEDGNVLGTYKTSGWSENGDISYVIPDDRGEQLEATTKPSERSTEPLKTTSEEDSEKK